MSIAEEDNESDGEDRSELNQEWSPFKQYYNHLEFSVKKVGASLDYNTVHSVIDAIFPEDDQDEEGQVWAEKLNLVQDFASVSHENSQCSYDNVVVNTPEHNFVYGDQAQSRKLWLHETLFDNYFQKENIDFGSWTWRQKFLQILPLVPGQLSVSVRQAAAVSISKQRDGSYTCISEEEGNKDTYDKPDPIYSGFASLRNGFHVSSEGLVFSSLEEMEIFKMKMADMEQKLQSELSAIQDQHEKLKAQKAEEKKLLPQQSVSQDSDHEEEATENQKLNDEDKQKKKTERKSGLFSSLQASLYAARSGIQGFWEKSSPTIYKDTKAQRVSQDSGDSDNETEKLKYRPNSKLPSSDGLDNHDEFTRQMQAEGGLTYEGADKTIQQVSHDALPPPLSLQSLQAPNISK